jgi:hypothetical protein
MKKHSSVIVNLHSPREKIWGVLLSVQNHGITLRSIDLNSFDDWVREVAKGETGIGLSTVFFPMHRVERVLLDEGVGDIQSLAEVFHSRVGDELWSYLGLPRPSDEDEMI